MAAVTSDKSKAKIESNRRKEEHKLTKPLEVYQKTEDEIEEERIEAQRM